MTGPGLSGRDRLGKGAPRYCCSGCLAIGERVAAGNGTSSAPRLDPVWIRVVVASALAAQSMLVGLAINLTPPEPTTKFAVQLILLAGTLVTLGLLGGPLASASLREARRGRLTTEALFMTGVIGALATSIFATWRGEGPVYYEVVSVLLIVWTIGKVLAARGRERTLVATRAWMLDIQTCRLLDASESERRIDAHEVNVGDRVAVLPGERIAVDGIVADGVAFVRETPISGEPAAVVKRPGDRVWAGTGCEDARLVIRANAPGDDRRIDRLIATVEAARGTPTSLQGLADRVARLLFPLVVVVAAASFAGWTAREGWRAGLMSSLAVLLVACPCAFGLATPVAIWTTLSKLAERGLVVRDASFVEHLAAANLAVFDKTGTLTEDRLSLVDFAVLDASSDERADLLATVAAVEAESRHPVARGFAALAVDHALFRVREQRIVPGQGVEALVETVDGPGEPRRVRIGREDWLARGDQASAARRLQELLLAVDSASRVYVAVNGRLRAVAAFGESRRATTDACLSELTTMGIGVEVMTGDSAAGAAAAGFANARSRLAPEDKYREVQSLNNAGRRVVFIGDGVNDAAAMSAASASVALAHGAEVAVEAATATLYGGDIATLAWSVAVCRSAIRILRVNLITAACYNVCGIALAAAGRLHPVAAALLMVGSSMWVSWRSTGIGQIAACDCAPPPSADDERPLVAPARAAAIHAVALAAQAPLVALLAGASFATSAVATFVAALTSIGIAKIWRRWDAIPHAVDMAYGMLTLGGLGMLAGWSIDLGFRPLADVSSACGCGLAASNNAWLGVTLGAPGMWVGMLLLGNAAMIGLGRRRIRIAPAEWLRANLGMVVGMAIGGWCASRLEIDDTRVLTLAHVVLMQAGMTIGMILFEHATIPLRRPFEWSPHDRPFVAERS